MKNAKKNIVVELVEDRKHCRDISIAFPKEIPSQGSWVWSNPLVKLKVKNKKGGEIINLNLRVSYFSLEGVSKVKFCLPSDMINNTSMLILYDETSTLAPDDAEPNKIKLSPMSLCSSSITIDNLDELLAQGK